MSGTDYLDSWYARLRVHTTDALAFLASSESAPFADAVMIEWLDTLVALRFGAEDVPLIVQLLDRADPHLQEAGVRLAGAAMRYVDPRLFEPALTRLASRELDPWVLDALVDLLALDRHAFTPIYEGLAVRQARERPTWAIARPRAIQPWKRLIQLCKQNVIQTLHPHARDFAYLPILERELGTSGWEATVRHVVAGMGVDPDDYFARLRGS
jgi:hypothetical protein